MQGLIGRGKGVGGSVKNLWVGVDRYAPLCNTERPFPPVQVRRLRGRGPGASGGTARQGRRPTSTVGGQQWARRGTTWPEATASDASASAASRSRTCVRAGLASRQRRLALAPRGYTSWCNPSADLYALRLGSAGEVVAPLCTSGESASVGPKWAPSCRPSNAYRGRGVLS
jgi:hypothetical protein